MPRCAIALLTLSLATLATARTATDSTNGNWLSSQGTGCQGTSTTLSDFENSTPDKSIQGGLWFAFTDSATSFPTSYRGSSTVVDDSTTRHGVVYLDNADGSLATALAGITATLDKGGATTHPHGGWAGLGTSFVDTLGNAIALDLTGLKAVSFYLSLPDAADTANLVGLNLRIQSDSIPDSTSFRAGFPFLPKFNNTALCIDASQFRREGSSDSLPLTRIRGFFWELRLKDGSTVAKPSAFYIGDVTLYGNSANSPVPCAALGRAAAARAACFDTGVGISRSAAATSFSARYAHGLVLSYALEGASRTRIDVLRLDGSKVAAFTHGARATNLSLPVNLSRGTYLAVIQGGAQKLVAAFTVTQ